MDTLDAKALAYQTLSEDGLIDLFCALGLLIIGAGWWQDQVTLSTIAPPLLIPFWMVARKRISEPRLGHVELREDTQMKLSKNLLWAALLGSAAMGTFVYFAFTVDDAPSITVQELIPALPTLIISVMAFIGWLLLRANRYILYAMGLLAAGAEVFIQGFEPHVGFFLGAILPVVIGSYVFVNFLRNNPVIDGQA